MASMDEVLALLQTIGDKEDAVSASMVDVKREILETKATVVALRDSLKAGPATQAKIDAAVAKANEIAGKLDAHAADIGTAATDLDAIQVDPDAPPTP